MKHLIFSLLFAVVFVSLVEAQNPHFSIQGTLRDDSGLAVADGAYNFTISIYDAATGGTPLWTRTFNNVNVQNGVYSIPITPTGVTYESTRYVGISVNGAAELMPRTVLGGAPYATSLPKTAMDAIVPVGTILPFAGVTAPPGWLLCNGGSYSTTEYAALYAVIGTRFGGSGGTFRVPDFRGRTPVMPGGSYGGSVGYTGGSTYNSTSVALSTSNLPSHSHSFSGNTSYDGSHTHGYVDWSVNYDTNTWVGGGDAGGGYVVFHDRDDRTTNSAGGHSHTFSGTTGNTGNGSAFNVGFDVRDPYLMVNFIIKY